MMNTESLKLTKDLMKGGFGKKCPICRNSMDEVDRVIENENLFVWYECMNVDCDGQWLEKKQAI